MKLESITISNIGPFFEKHTMALSDHVTVITGGNDLGKSKILDCLDIFQKRDVIKESDVNLRYMFENVEEWQVDEDIYISLNFKNLNSKSETLRQSGSTHNIAPNESVEIRYYPSKGMDRSYHLVRENGSKNAVAIRNPFGTKIIKLEHADLNIEEEIKIGNTNQLTTRLLNAAFNGNDYAKSLNSLRGRFLKEQKVDRANDYLKNKLSTLMEVNDSTIQLSLSGESIRLDIVDGSGQRTPLSYRSSGTLKYISFIVQVDLAKDEAKDQLVILADEPGIYLHANSQHFLRKKFEEVSSLKRINTIYVTHSPSMINQMRPESIRILKRSHDKDNRFTNSFIDQYDMQKNNYSKIRTSLGITPLDSLLYSPICLVVEGKTEALACREIFNLMKEIGHINQSEYENIGNLIHIIDGQGSKLGPYCKLVESQGEYPIVFCDGDQIDSVESSLKANGSFRLVHMPKQTEFEQLIKRPIYFEALDNELLLNNSEKKFAEFIKELPDDDVIRKKAFTKQVESWLKLNNPDVVYRKPVVMLNAIKNIKSIDDLEYPSVLQKLRDEIFTVMKLIE